MKNALCMTIALGTALLFLNTPPAQAGKCGKEGKKQELTSLSLSGSVISEQREVTKKDGAVAVLTVYYLQTDGEKIQLPEAKSCKKDEVPSYSLSDLKGATVKVEAKGFTKKNKQGETRTHIAHITSIARVEAATEA